MTYEVRVAAAVGTGSPGVGYTVTRLVEVVVSTYRVLVYVSRGTDRFTVWVEMKSAVYTVT